MRFGLMSCLLIWFCLATAYADDACPSLSEIVLFSVQPLSAFDPDRYPEEGRPCVKAYLKAVSPEALALMTTAPAPFDKALASRRKNMTAHLMTIFGNGIREEAERFSNIVPLLVEWEGMSEGPVDEANFADQWLNKFPDTPIAPFLHLFKAHRLRAGFEAARAGHEKGLWPILARRYRESLQTAKSSSNPLIACIAEDLAAQPYVYLKDQGVP